MQREAAHTFFFAGLSDHEDKEEGRPAAVTKLCYVVLGMLNADDLSGQAATCLPLLLHLYPLVEAYNAHTGDDKLETFKEILEMCQEKPKCTRTLPTPKVRYMSATQHWQARARSDESRKR